MKSNSTEQWLALRARLKKRKPVFIRQDNILKALEKKWRRPRGVQSKMRLQKRGQPLSISKGYKSPSAVRGMLKIGKYPVLVFNLSDLSKIDTDVQAAIISGNVGMKNKLAIIKKAIELKITIANIKDPSAFLNEKENEFRQRSQDKKKQSMEKEQKHKKLAETSKKDKTSIDKIAQESSTNEDDKKSEEKKKADKVLTAKDAGY